MISPAATSRPLPVPDSAHFPPAVTPSRPMPTVTRSTGVVAVLLTAAALALHARAVPAQAPQQQLRIGSTVAEFDELEFDFKTRQYTFSGNVRLTTRDGYLKAPRMVVQRTAEQALDWARCEGGVYLERKNAEDGTVMTGEGRTLEYYELKQLAHLVGAAVVRQSSPRLARPAVVRGERIDMNLESRVHVVAGVPGKQAVAHLEPLGRPGPDGKPGVPPEPVDLIADRISMKSATQEYEAVGNPRFVRPSSRLTAEVIRFQVDPSSNDVRTATAQRRVVFDGKGEQGSLVHATGDLGTFDKETSEVTLTGNVHATVRDPDEEEPSVYQGHQFLYNTQTGYRKLIRGKDAQASVVLPPGKAARTESTPARPENPPR
jgi:lipopolysaccharide transport protein LptA